MGVLGFLEELLEWFQSKCSNSKFGQLVLVRKFSSALGNMCGRAKAKLPFGDATKTHPMGEFKTPEEPQPHHQSAPPSEPPTQHSAEPVMQTQKKQPSKRSVSIAGVTSVMASLLKKVVVVSILGALAWLSWQEYQQGDYVAVAALLLVAFGALIGFLRGIIGTIISLVGFVAAYLTAPQLGAAYEQLVADRLGTAGILNRTVAIGVAGLIVFVVFSIVSSLIWRLMAGRSEEGRSIIDRVLGLAGGAAQAALSILLFLGGFSVIKPALPTPADLPDDAVAGHRVLALSEAIDRSKLKPWVEQYNPFEKVPQLEEIAEIRQTIAELNSPKRVRQVMRHPSVLELRKDPEMKKAVQGLTGETAIVELMTGKRPFDKSAVGTFLQSDAVLNLIEQPGFLEAAKDILLESQEEMPASESSSTRTRYTSQ